MDKKQREEWLDLFEEAFAGIVVPRFEALEGDVVEIKKDISEIKETLERMDRTLDKHGDRIFKLETSSSVQ